MYNRESECTTHDIRPSYVTPSEFQIVVSVTPSEYFRNIQNYIFLKCMNEARNMSNSLKKLIK